MSKVLLLGGTGAMGVYLREILAAEGKDVLVTSRSEQMPRAGVEFLRGDARDLGFLSSVLDRVRPDAIVDFMIYGTDEFKARRDLLLGKARHYLFLSSYRVFNDAEVITERTPRLLDSSTDSAYLKMDEYALCKARSEDFLRESGKTNWTIIRPGITYSKRRFQLGCLEANTLCYRSFQGLPVAMPPEMRLKQTTMTWGRDVALMIARLVLNPKAYGEDFNCASAEHHSWDEICGLYKRMIGAEVRDCTIEDYIRIVGNSAQVRYDRMFNRIIDNGKVLAATGLKQEQLLTLDVGLSRELESFRKNPVYQYPNVAINARLDRVLGTSISLRGFSLRQRREYYAIRYPLFGLFVRGVGKLKRAMLADD